MGPIGSVPPIKISAGPFLSGALPSALYPARHQPSKRGFYALVMSFRLRKFRMIFAGNTYKYHILWQTTHPRPMSFSP